LLPEETLATRRIVGYARGEHRRDRRRETVVRGYIDGISVRLRNISHSGLDVEIEDAEPDLGRWAVGQVCILALEGSDQQGAMLDLHITRLDPDNARLAGSFESVSDEQYNLIEKLVLRGRLTSNP